MSRKIIDNPNFLMNLSSQEISKKINDPKYNKPNLRELLRRSIKLVKNYENYYMTETGSKERLIPKNLAMLVDIDEYVLNEELLKSEYNKEKIQTLILMSIESSNKHLKFIENFKNEKTEEQIQRVKGFIEGLKELQEKYKLFISSGYYKEVDRDYEGNYYTSHCGSYLTLLNEDGFELTESIELLREFVDNDY